MASSGRVLLIAADTSSVSQRALRWVFDHFYRQGDVLHIVHVVPNSRIITSVDFLPVQSINEEAELKKAEEYVQSELLPLVATLKPDITPVVHFVKSELDAESVGEVLVRKAEELGAACLFCASSNKGVLTELFLGSVCNYCVHKSKLPVAVIR